MPDKKKKDIQKLAKNMHDAGLVNLNMKLSDVLKIDPSGPVSDNAIAWSDYVLVTKGKLGDLSKVKRITKG